MLGSRVVDSALAPWRQKISTILFPYAHRRGTGQSSTIRNLGWFELTMIIVYIANMTCLALRTGYDVYGSTKVTVLKSLDLAFSIIYLVEITTAGIAFGFTSLTNPVRLLDLTLVMANLILLIAFMLGINQSRTDISLLPARCSLRILRPFFVTTDFVNVRLFVVSVSKSILRLNEVLLLLLLFLLWFGIAGVFQFGGLLRNRCIADFYNIAAMSIRNQDDFFGPASTLSGQVTKYNSSLYTSDLSTPYSSYLSTAMIFDDIITNPAVSEFMVVRAIASFAASFVALNGQVMTDYVCGSNVLTGSPTVLDAVTAFLTIVPEATVEEASRRYVHRPAVVYNLSDPIPLPPPARNGSTRAPYFPYRLLLKENAAVTATQSHTLVAPVISYEYSDYINSAQLLAILQQTFQLDATLACSLEQTCDLSPDSTIHGFVCPYSYTCQPDIYNPYNNTVSFDNIAMSILTLQTAITQQLWYELLFWERDSSDALSYAFMPPVVFIGGYIIINLIIVTLTISYEEMRRAERLKVHQETLGKSGDEDEEEGRQGEDQEEDADTRKRNRQIMKQSVTMQNDEDRRARRNSLLGAVQAATRTARSKSKMDPGETEGDAEPALDVPLLIADNSTPVAIEAAAVSNASAPPDIDSDDSEQQDMLLQQEIEEARKRKLQARLRQSATGVANESFAAQDSFVRVDSGADDALRDGDRGSNSGDSDVDEYEVDEMTRRRRAARAIYRRKWGRETKLWKKKFRSARFYAKWYIVERHWFSLLFVLVILANTALICYEHFGMDPRILDAFNKANIAFTAFFVLEFAIRMLADKWTRFTKDPFNIFDMGNALIAVTDVVLGSQIAFLRALRIFRVFKLIKMNHELYQWIIFILEACKASPVLVLFLFLVMFIFSTFGIQVYGGQLCGLDTSGALPGDTTYVNISDPSQPLVTIPSGYQSPTMCQGLPRMNFDTFGDAMLTSFIIATSDNWNYPMYQAMTAINKLVAIPFIIYYFVTVYIITSLLVTILLSANEKQETLEEILEQEKKRQTQQMDMTKQIEEQREQLRVQQENEEEDDDDSEEAEMSDLGSDAPEGDNRDFVITKSGKVRTKAVTTKVMDELVLLWDKSHRGVRSMVESSPWNIFMGLAVVISCVSMGLEDPIAAPDTRLIRNLHIVDIVTTSLFAFELLLFVHAYGLLRRRSSYLRRDWWNLVDAVLVVGSIVGVSYPQKSDSAGAIVITIFRALRGLRIIRRVSSLRIVLNTVVGALPEMKNVFVVSFGLFAVWGVFGVSFFQGKLRQCLINGSTAPELDEPTCVAMGGSYVNLDLNFDNLPSAMLMIFICALLEDWSPEMFRTTDVTAAGEPFRRNATPLASLYFSIAAAFAGLLLMNLFVSVVVASYNRQKRRAAFQRSSLVTQEQEAWLMTVKRLARQLPLRNQRRMMEDQAVVVTARGQVSVVSQVSTDRPISVISVNAIRNDGSNFKRAKILLNKARAKVRIIVRSSTFNNFWHILVLVNFVAQLAQHYPQSNTYTTTINAINTVFAFLWLVESSLKIFGETLPVYLSSQWNRLDLIVAVVSVLSIFLSYVYSSRSFQLIVNMRVVRLARFTKNIVKLDRMIARIAVAVLSIGNVILLIMVVFLIYAVIGMKLFGKIAQQPWGSGPTGGASNAIDTHTNFGSLGASMLLLSRITTGGDYPYIMMACSAAFTSEALSNCDMQLGTCGLPAPTSEFYFVSFVFISTIILTNLFVAVLLDSFESSGFNRSISKKDAQEFYRQWKSLDPAETLTLCPFDVLPLLRSFQPHCVLGFMRWPKRKRVGMELQFLTSLQLVDVSHRITVCSLVDALCQAAFPVPQPHGAAFGNYVFESMLKQPQKNIGRRFLQLRKTFSELREVTQSNVTRFTQIVSGGADSSRRRRRKSTKKSAWDLSTLTDFLASEALDEIRFNPELLPLRYQRELMIRFDIKEGDVTDEHVAAAIARLPPREELERMYAAEVEATRLRHEKEERRRILGDDLDDDEGDDQLAATQSQALQRRRSMSTIKAKPPTTAKAGGTSVSFSQELSPGGNQNDAGETELTAIRPARGEVHNPLIESFMPHDTQHLFAMCASLIFINSVVKARRDDIRSRMKSVKTERDVIQRLRDLHGIVVPQHVIDQLIGGTSGGGAGGGGGGRRQLLLDSPPSPLGVGSSEGHHGAPPPLQIGSSVAIGSDELFVAGSKNLPDEPPAATRLQRSKSILAASKAGSNSPKPEQPSVSEDPPADAEPVIDESITVLKAKNRRRQMAPADQLVPKGLEFESLRWQSTATKKPPQDANHPSVARQQKGAAGFIERLPIDPEKIFMSLDHDPIEASNLHSHLTSLTSAICRAAAFCDELAAMFPPDVKLSDDAMFLVERIAAYTASVAQSMCAFVKAHLIGDGTIGELFEMRQQQKQLAVALKAARELVSRVVAPKCPRSVVSIDQICRSLTQQKEAQNKETQRLEAVYGALCSKAEDLEHRVIGEEMGARAKELIGRSIQLLIPAMVVDTKEFVDSAWEVVFPSTLQNAKGQTRLSDSTVLFKKFFAQRMIEVVDAVIKTFPRLADIKMLIDPGNAAFHDALRAGKLTTAQKVVLRYFSVAVGQQGASEASPTSGDSKTSSSPAPSASTSNTNNVPILQALERVAISSLFTSGATELPTSLSFVQAIQRVRDSLRAALSRVRWSGAAPTSESTITNIIKIAVTGEAAKLHLGSDAAASVVPLSAVSGSPTPITPKDKESAPGGITAGAARLSFTFDDLKILPDAAIAGAVVKYFKTISAESYIKRGDSDMLTLAEYRGMLVGQLTDAEAVLETIATQLIVAPQLRLRAVCSLATSMTPAKHQDVLDFAQFVVREHVVLQERDALNAKLQAHQREKVLLREREKDVDVLHRSCGLYAFPVERIFIPVGQGATPAPLAGEEDPLVPPRKVPIVCFHTQPHEGALMRLDEVLCCSAIVDAAVGDTPGNQTTTDLLEGLAQLASRSNAAASAAIRFAAVDKMTLTASSGYDRTRTSDEADIASTAAKLQRSLEDASRGIALVLQTCIDVSASYIPPTQPAKRSGASATRGSARPPPPIPLQDQHQENKSFKWDAVDDSIDLGLRVMCFGAPQPGKASQAVAPPAVAISEAGRSISSFPSLGAVAGIGAEHEDPFLLESNSSIIPPADEPTQQPPAQMVKAEPRSAQRALADAKRRSELRRMGQSTQILLSPRAARPLDEGREAASLASSVRSEVPHILLATGSASVAATGVVSKGNANAAGAAQSHQLRKSAQLPQPQVLDQLLTNGVAARFFVQRTPNERLPSSDALFYPIQLKLAFVDTSSARDASTPAAQRGMELRLCKRSRDEAQHVLSFANDIIAADIRSRRRTGSTSGARTPTSSLSEGALEQQSGVLLALTVRRSSVKLNSGSAQDDEEVGQATVYLIESTLAAYAAASEVSSAKALEAIHSLVGSAATRENRTSTALSKQRRSAQQPMMSLTEGHDASML